MRFSSSKQVSPRKDEDKEKEELPQTVSVPLNLNYTYFFNLCIDRGSQGFVFGSCLGIHFTASWSKLLSLLLMSDELDDIM